MPASQTGSQEKGSQENHYRGRVMPSYKGPKKPPQTKMGGKKKPIKKK